MEQMLVENLSRKSRRKSACLKIQNLRMVLNGTKPYQVQKQAPTPSEYDMEGTPPCARN